MLRIHGEVIKLGIKISGRTISCLIQLNILQSNKQLNQEIRFCPCDTFVKKVDISGLICYSIRYLCNTFLFTIKVESVESNLFKQDC